MSQHIAREDGYAATVSVVIPAHNAAAWVSEAIHSALDQTRPPLEIIVVDDGSTDDTWRVASRFPHPVRALWKPNGGPASARNFGIAAASGTWIGLLDADDRWAPQKLERQLALVAPDIALIHTLDDGEPRELPDTLTFDDLWQANQITNSSVLVRRSVVIELGGFNEDVGLKSVEDYHLWLRLAYSGGKIVSCQEPLTFYRRGVGLSSNTAKFLEASLYNFDDLGRRLNLPVDSVRSRKLRTMDEFGRAFLFERHLAAARSVFAQTFATAPNLRRAANLGISHLPASVLDLRRGMLYRRGARRVPIDEMPDVDDRAPVIPLQEPPYLLAIIDTEEEFDWDARPPAAARIRNLSEQGKGQRIFERFGVVPTYAIDYPVASQPEGRQPLLEFLQDGRCEIGAHLHPWVTPPVEEELTTHNTFPGNLPRELERAKLMRLTETIEANFGSKPVLYRAGRYGLGAHTFDTLSELGYQIDCSMLPFVDLSGKGGPDYMRCATAPSWVGGDPTRRLLEIPVTSGVIGRLAKGNRDLYRIALSPRAEQLHLTGLLARLGLLNRIRLTPEGSSLAEAMRLTEAMMRHGQRVFVLSYHSSSLRIGETSYVRTAADLDRFLTWIERFLEFFFGKLGGRPATPGLIYRRALAAESGRRGEFGLAGGLAAAAVGVS